MRIKVAVETPTSTTRRAKLLSAMFDVPPSAVSRHSWDVSLDLESEPWTIGLIVGPSGSGKSTVMRAGWGEPVKLEWGGAGVIDDFPAAASIEAIADVCAAVGFNTIPAWQRPFKVLSNGEQFRADLARRLIVGGDVVVVDEFTSVVDRQVAQIGSHATQKYCRRVGQKFVAVGCHYDVIDWLQPDWILDMSTQQFTRRLLRRRPEIHIAIGRLPRAAWEVFAPFHYMTGDMHVSAKCFGLWANGRLASFCGLMYQPVSSGTGSPIWNASRVVTLPDWQGLGLVFVLLDALAAEMAAKGCRLYFHPAHPTFIRSTSRAPDWRLVKLPPVGGTKKSTSTNVGAMGGRPCATFAYCGPPAKTVTLL